MKFAKSIFFVCSAVMLVSSVQANPVYSGKCAKQAEAAAIDKWSDVPNPSANLEYQTVSSNVDSKDSATYHVLLGLFDGNESFPAQYKVVFADSKTCQAPTAVSEAYSGK
jgi:hypothetical protein